MVSDVGPGVLLVERTGDGGTQQSLGLGGKAGEEMDGDTVVTNPFKTPDRAEGRHRVGNHRLAALAKRRAHALRDDDVEIRAFVPFAP